MRISEMLNAIASWLESPNNEALLLSEYNEDCMKIVANSCVLAAELLKNAAEEVDSIEPEEESKITAESISQIASLAEIFDASGDPELKKQASVLDELLLSYASPPNAIKEKIAAQDYRLEELKKKYQENKKKLNEVNKIADSEKIINDFFKNKEYRILESPLSTRYCPDHAGVQITRVGEHLWQCEMDKKVYDFENGFKLLNGDKVPGGSVSEQTKRDDSGMHAIFDSRESRLAAK